MSHPPSQPHAPPGSHGWFSTVALGVGCLCAGVLLGGRFWPWRGTHVYTERPQAREGDAGTVPPTFADVVERVAPGVVSVRALVQDETGSAAAGESVGVRSGSGFVLNRTGLIVTARHLTLGAARIVIEVPQLGTFDASLVGEDDVTDLAVLRLVAPPDRLTVLELGHSERLRAGDWIVAVGNPFGFKQSVTAGIVSFVGRHLHHYDVKVSSDFLQFSAPVNPGSSGCPVLDLDGRVVGVTTQAADAAQGISFAIPSRTLKWVLDAMDKSPDGRVHRGQMGIGFDSRSGVDDHGRPLEGAVVRQVVEGGAAAERGLEAGDVILRVDEHPIVDASDLHERITHTAPGAMLRLTIMRGGHVLEPLPVELRDAAGPRERDGELVH